MSYMRDFEAEYSYTVEGVTVMVEKAGGGTLGKLYDGTWWFVIIDAEGNELCRDMMGVGMPHSHHAIACIVHRWYEEGNIMINENEYMPYADEQEAFEAFDQFINEVTPMVTVLGIDYDPSRVLKEIDPIAYRTEFSNWLDSEQRNY